MFTMNTNEKRVFKIKYIAAKGAQSFPIIIASYLANQISYVFQNCMEIYYDNSELLLY
jgi:hypothetical protein